MPTTSPDAALALTAGADHLTAGCRADLTRARTGAEALVAGAATLPPAEALARFDQAFSALSEAGSRASLARNVHPDAAVRDAAEACEQEVAALATRLSLDRGLYEALAALDPSGLDATARFFLEKALRDFRRGGVDKDDATRARVQALQEELVRIGQEFGRTIRDDVRRLSLPPEALDGLPEDWRRAHPPGPDGLVAVTTDATDYVPFMTYARDEAARAELWRLYRLRGHPANLEVLSRLLARRAELAGLLGYPTWAAFVTEDKMIGSQQAAADFIERIAALSGGRMEREYAQLLARKRADAPAAERVEPWDSTFLQERVKAEQYGYDSQSARPYLEYGRVRDGLLDVTGALLGVEYRRVAGAPSWHPDVEAFDVVDRAAGTPLGRIHLDMFPRPGKYKHFAQFTLASGVAGQRLPEGVLVCNFPQPRAGAPALLEHGEVRTFFHEFGHLLHHVLGGHTRYAAHSGVATEWDFVEAPSQMLEEWIWDPAVLARFAHHLDTGAPIPAELVARMKAADEYGKGLQVRQQMFYAAVSLELHRRPPDGLDTTALVAELQARYTPFRHVEGTYFHESFGHLDGYSAIYYTYMWSLVIAKDLFGEFRAAGLMDPATAARYRRAVLEPGGSRPAAALVQDFLGRPSGFEAYRAWLEAG
ncbi:MAG: Zn-dependent oligopeptidase [Anaeromyxobacter sp.]|nr:Zn-dependent oligopeptidase [Anaeromyxobacter sp.]MBL0277087.1 Zn-dependent oligopeptidase [Anaeromyxobacter sp.]